jgi:hypothetical protein
MLDVRGSIPGKGNNFALRHSIPTLTEIPSLLSGGYRILWSTADGAPSLPPVYTSSELRIRGALHTPPVRHYDGA